MDGHEEIVEIKPNGQHCGEAHTKCKHLRSNAKREQVRASTLNDQNNFNSRARFSVSSSSFRVFNVVVLLVALFVPALAAALEDSHD